MKQHAAQQAVEVGASEEAHDPEQQRASSDERSRALYDEELSSAHEDERTAKVGEMVYFSPRFMGDEVLASIHLGETTLKQGDSGLAVSRVQAALSDLGYTTTIDGDFGASTADAVREFRIDDAEIVDQSMMFDLDAEFQDHTDDADRASSATGKKRPKPNQEFKRGKAPKGLLEGTHKLNKYEAREAQALLEPISEVDPDTGKKREFKEDVGTGAYVDRLRDIVNAEVDDQYATYAAGNAEAREDPSKLYDAKDIAAIGSPAKDVVDAVFGNYATGEAMIVQDRWAVQESKIDKLEKTRTNGGKEGEAADAKLADIGRWRVQKIINENLLVRDLNDEHGAIVDKDPANKFVDAIISEVSNARRSELLEIQKGWGGSADPETRTVYLQMFRTAENAAGDRTFMWNQFETIIHEYLHTLAHSRFREYTTKVDEAKSHALREGMTDYLTKLVWSTVKTDDPNLRKRVEGPYHDPNDTTPPPPLQTYSEAVEAEQVVGLVGARNAFAAYFLGEVELIGGKV